MKERGILKQRGVACETYETLIVFCNAQEVLEPWQCANAVEGAAEAALAARKVPVGGAKPSDALQQLVQYPPVWVMLLALALNYAQVGFMARSYSQATGMQLPDWILLGDSCIFTLV